MVFVMFGQTLIIYVISFNIVNFVNNENLYYVSISVWVDYHTQSTHIH